MSSLYLAFGLGCILGFSFGVVLMFLLEHLGSS